MKFVLAILAVLSLTACATADGIRTDVGNSVQSVGEWIKPSDKGR